MLDSDAVLMWLSSDPSTTSPLDPAYVMPRSDSVKKRPLATFVRSIIVATALIAVTASVAGCGQRGPLYYPDKDNPDRRR